MTSQSTDAPPPDASDIAEVAPETTAGSFVTSLLAGNSRPLRVWLEVTLSPAMDGRRAVLPDADTRASFRSLEETLWWSDAGGVNAISAVQSLIMRAAITPGAWAPFCVYIRTESAKVWEQSEDLSGIDALIDLTLRCWRERTAAHEWTTGIYAARESDDASVLNVLSVGLLETLRYQLAVEDFANAGTLDGWAAKAREASRFGETLQASTLNGRGDSFGAYLSSEISKTVVYFRAVAVAAAAASSFCRMEGNHLGTAIQALRVAEDNCHPIEASELRAHRVSLERLDAAKHRDWLRIDRARCSISYPFGIRGLDANKLVSVARNMAHTWAIAGQPVAAVRGNLPVSDIWNGRDPLGRSFAGACLRLDELVFPNTQSGEPLIMRPEIWFSELGNHQIKFDFEIVNALPQDIFWIQRLAATEFGELSINSQALMVLEDWVETESTTQPAGSRWPNLAAFVRHSVDSLVEILRSDESEVSSIAESAWGVDVAVRAQGGVSASFTPTHAHLLLKVDLVSSVNRGSLEERRIESYEQVRGLFGSSVLQHPTGAIVNSICEWAQFDEEHSASLDIRGFGGAQLLQTGNTSAVFCFGAPSFLADGLGECLTFVASLSGAFAAWHEDTATEARATQVELADAASALKRTSTSGRLRAQDIGELEQKVHQRRLRIEMLVNQYGSIMTFIESGTLMKSRLTRMVLEECLRRAGFSAMRDGLANSALGGVNSQVESILVKIRLELAEAERAERRSRHRRSALALDAMMAGITVAGISGIAAIIQTGYDMKQLAAISLALGVFLFSFVIGVVVWRSRSRDSG